MNDRQTKIEAKLAVVAWDRKRAKDRRRQDRARHERITVIRGTKCGGRGDVEPRAEVEGYGHARRELKTRHGGGRVDDAVVAMQGADKRVETEVHGNVCE